MNRLILKGARIVDPSQELDSIGDILIEDGQIVKVAKEITESVETIDLQGKILMPGLIDTHSHFREPGFEHKEDLESGSLAALRGGYTSVFAMANTDPVIDNPAGVRYIKDRAREIDLVRIFPVAALSKGMAGKELTEFGALKKEGVVALSDDGMPVENPQFLRLALMYSEYFDLPVILHEEDKRFSGKGVMHEGELSIRLGLRGIPAVAEETMVLRDLLLQKNYGGIVHFAHISSRGSLRAIAEAKKAGQRVSCEVTPHHLLLTEEVVKELNYSTDTKMNPPLRTREDMEALGEGLINGEIDFVATDHAPHHPDEKDVEYDFAPFGIVGLETAIPLIWDRFVKTGRMTVSRFVEVFSMRPANLFNLDGLGTLKENTVADITVIDPDRFKVVNPDAFASKARNTPFRGFGLTGWPVMTIVGGKIKWQDM